MRIPLLAAAGALFAPLLRLVGMGRPSHSFILSVGDEGASLVQVRHGQVVDALFVAADAEEGPDSLREMIAADPRSEIIIVADVVEQMFREDTLPKVGILDRGKVVRRRLDLAYPNDRLKGALPLPRPRGAPQSLLFAALPLSPNLERWIAFVESLPNPLQGFYMLPLEVLDLAQRLGPPATGETRTVWRALITQEAASGYRQVFESSGKLVVTRLTQRQMQEGNADAEAMLIERELRSSISYVKRLGFNEADRLDVVLLADPAVCRAVDERDLPATSLTTLTPYQAGIIAGLGDVGREDSPFSDVLLGLWVALRGRRKLVLPTDVMHRRMLQAAMVRWGTVAAVALTLASLYYSADFLGDYFDAADRLDRVQVEVRQADSALAGEMRKMRNSEIPLDQLAQVAQVEETLARNEVDFVPLLGRLAGVLDENSRAVKIAFGAAGEGGLPAAGPQQPQPKPPARPETPAKPAAGYEIRLSVSLTSAGEPSSPEVALGQAKDLLARLAAAFPGYQVEAVSLPAGLMVNQAMEGGNAPGGAAPRKPAQAIAEYVIRKEA